MKHFIKILFFILIPFFAFSQSLGKNAGKTRLAPTTQLRKGTKPNQILMTRQSDTSLVYSDLDTILKPTKYLSLMDTTCTSWNGGYVYMCQDGVGATLQNVVINGNTYTLNQPLYDGSGNHTALNTAVQNAISSAGYSATVIGFDDGVCYEIDFSLTSGCSPLIIDFNWFDGTNNQTTQGSSDPNATITQVDINTLIDTAIANCPSLTVAKLDSCNVSYLYMFNCSTGQWETFKTTEIKTAGKTLFVDEVTGNDATAKKGCPTCAFKTIDAALNVISDGDLLKVLAGNYVNNISANSSFNIECDNGVNWEIKAKLINPSPTRKLNRMAWKFDRIYSNNYFNAFGSDTLVKMDIFANEVNNVGIGSGSINETVVINKCIDCKTGIYSSSPNAISNVQIKNMTSTKTYGVANFNSFPVQARNSSTNVEVDNINIRHSSSAWQGVFNFDYNQGGSRKYNLLLHNVLFYPTNQYSILPPLYSSKSAYGLDGDNTLVYIGNSLLDSTIANIEIDNYKGSGHAVVVNGYGNTIGQTLFVKIKGTFYKGIPFSIEALNQSSINTKIVVDLDVDCYDGIGVLLGIDNFADANSTSSITITGKIRTHNNPCIVLQGGLNGRVFLENLALTNIGGTYSIESNSSQNVVVKPNCVSNLAPTANITQLGSSILVDSNFNN